MPLIPEAVVAMLVCARIGAIHSVVFGVIFSRCASLVFKMQMQRFVITADGGFRKGAAFALKTAADDALKGATNVAKVLVVKRTWPRYSLG
jgi:acetyl-CoA synthetase